MLNYILHCQIPLLNVADTQYLKEGSLVRFRGMVQDMYDPEYYYEKYEVVNVDTNVRSARNGKYYDTAHWKVGICRFGVPRS